MLWAQNITKFEFGWEEEGEEEEKAGEEKREEILPS